MTRDRSQAITRSKWFMPAFSLGLGVVVLGASSLGGHPGAGLVSLAIMAGFGLFLVLAGRSKTIRGLRGDGRDERFAQIDLQATAVAGLVLIITLIVAWLVEIARGDNGSPYYWLCATRSRVTLHSSDTDATVRSLVTSDLQWSGLQVGEPDLETSFLRLPGEGS